MLKLVPATSLEKARKDEVIFIDRHFYILLLSWMFNCDILRADFKAYKNNIVKHPTEMLLTLNMSPLEGIVIVCNYDKTRRFVAVRA